MSDIHLITGACGLVGRYTVDALAAKGARVVATDLDTPTNRAIARGMPGGVEARWADLTDREQVDQLIAAVAPAAIVHLAAVIPPAAYRNVRLARAVNVDATVGLLAAAERLVSPPRFVQVSSVAVYGARNPHRHADLLRSDTPLRSSDCYGQHKIEAEAAVRASSLPWAILRLGAVISTNFRAMTVDADALYLEWSFPVDGRINTVDVRDVATACVAATTADVVGETLLIGGDESHRMLQGDVGPALVGAAGLAGAYPSGRLGDPNDDAEWFVCDWMDTEPAQRALGFQDHSWPQMLQEIRDEVGLLRYPLRLTAPALRLYLARRTPYRDARGEYAAPWAVGARRWPESVPDA